VPRITRRDAEKIFYRALEVYATPSSQFADVRDACVWAARDIYGQGSPQQAATEKAWCAVGVRPETCAPPGNESIRLQQVAPSTMTAGQTYNVWVTMYNTGTTTWTADVYKLGSQNPQNNNVWGVSRVSMPGWFTIAPGSEHMFYFTVRAPSVPGQYNFQWRMVKEPGQWFGEYSNNQVITVTSP